MSAVLATTSAPPPHTILGIWHSSPANTTVDLEAQVILGTHIVVPEHTPARVSNGRRQSMEGTDLINDFLGVTRPRGTQVSRHNDVHSMNHMDDDDIPPPPYANSGDLPSYTEVAEPPTLAMYLFKFGFLFPLFWLAGILILLCPLTPPEDWEPTKTETERKELLGLLRRTEVKWAKRCLFTFAALSTLVVIIAVTAILVLKSS